MHPKSHPGCIRSRSCYVHVTFMACRGAILCARPIKWLPATNAPALQMKHPHRDTGERQRAPPSAPSAPSAPRTRKSPPQCAAHSSAPAPPSEHTHIESTCRRSRRTPQVQFSLSTPHESSVAGQPATASGVAIIYVYLGAPGMSPTPRSAKYPATHSCHRLRGGGNARLRSSAPPSAENKSDPSDWSDRSDQSDQSDGTMALFHIATTHPLKTAFLF